MGTSKKLDQNLEKLFEKQLKLKQFEKGSVVRSKSTPDFGKGIVTKVVGESDVMVSFPLSKLISKRPIRCHTSNLQIIGKIDVDSKTFTQVFGS